MYTVIESSYGHSFMSTDVDVHDICIICGAMYEVIPRPGSYDMRPATEEETDFWLKGYSSFTGAVETEDGLMIPDNPTGRYVAANGDDARECTGNNNMGHGEEMSEDSDCICLFCAG